MKTTLPHSGLMIGLVSALAFAACKKPVSELGSTSFEEAAPESIIDEPVHPEML